MPFASFRHLDSCATPLRYAATFGAQDGATEHGTVIPSSFAEVGGTTSVGLAAVIADRTCAGVSTAAVLDTAALLVLLATVSPEVVELLLAAVLLATVFGATTGATGFCTGVD